MNTRTKLSMLATVAAAAVTLVLPQSAEAVRVGRPWGDYMVHDSNHRVPENYGCYRGRWLGITRCRGTYRGIACRIFYDRCAMRRAGATARGWDRVRAHERAHARGFGHWEDSPRRNPAYYPAVRVR